MQKLGRLFLSNSPSDTHRTEQPADRAERGRSRDAQPNAQRKPPAANTDAASLSPTSAGRSLSPVPHHRTGGTAAPPAPSRPRPPERGTAAPGPRRKGRSPGRGPSGGGSAFPEPERPLPAPRAEAGAARPGHRAGPSPAGLSRGAAPGGGGVKVPRKAPAAPCGPCSSRPAPPGTRVPPGNFQAGSLLAPHSLPVMGSLVIPPVLGHIVGAMPANAIFSQPGLLVPKTQV